MTDMFRVITYYRGSQIAQPPMNAAEYEGFIAYIGADNRARSARPEMVVVSEWTDGVFQGAYVRDVQDIRRSYNDEEIGDLDLTEYPTVQARTIVRKTA